MRPRRAVSEIKHDLEREKWAVQIGATLTGVIAGVLVEAALWVLRFFIPDAFNELRPGVSFCLGLILGTVLGAWLNSWADQKPPEGWDR